MRTKSRTKTRSRQKGSTWSDLPGHQRICPTTAKPVKRRTVHQHLQMIRLSVIIEAVKEKEDASSIRIAVIIALQRQLTKISKSRRMDSSKKHWHYRWPSIFSHLKVDFPRSWCPLDWAPCVCVPLLVSLTLIWCKPRSSQCFRPQLARQCPQTWHAGIRSVSTTNLIVSGASRRTFSKRWVMQSSNISFRGQIGRTGLISSDFCWKSHKVNPSGRKGKYSKSS